MDVEDSMDDHDPEHEADRLSPISSESVPILPNKNAVYVVSSPLHHHPQPSLHTSRCDSPIIEIIPQDPNDDSHTAHIAPLANGNDNNNEKRQIVENGHNNNEAEMEEVTEESCENGRDYSRQRSNSFDSNSSLDGAGSEKGERSGSEQNSVDAERERDQAIEVKREVEQNRDGDYPSSSTTSTPSPQQHLMPMSTPQPPPAHQSHAMALTPIHHPMNLHYMHPAAAHALYASLESSAMLSPSPFKDSSPMSAEERKKRSRVFIDPLSEIPKLEKWFAEDTHPSSYMIEKYTEELNRSEYRQRFPKLEPKNVQLWFKNHRAKVKRGRLEQ